VRPSNRDQGGRQHEAALGEEAMPAVGRPALAGGAETIAEFVNW
jgi:hypothetical protein